MRSTERNLLVRDHTGLSLLMALVQPAPHLGAFFNGVFLLALALSVFLQSIERFIHLEEVHEPILVLIVGAVGLTLNIISALVVHGAVSLHTSLPSPRVCQAFDIQLTSRSLRPSWPWTRSWGA